MALDVSERIDRCVRCRNVSARRVARQRAQPFGVGDVALFVVLNERIEDFCRRVGCPERFFEYTQCLNAPIRSSSAIDDVNRRESLLKSPCERFAVGDREALRDRTADE